MLIISIFFIISLIIVSCVLNTNSTPENFEKIKDKDRLESDNYLKNRLNSFKDEYSKAETIIESRNELMKEIKQEQDKMKEIESKIIETQSKKNSLFSF